MDRNHRDEDLVDLGAASLETRGGPVGKEDQERTFILALALSDD